MIIKIVERFVNLTPGIIWGALVVLLAGSVIISSGNFLQNVHWDSAIYSYLGKRFAETNIFSSYLRHKDEIAAQTTDIEKHAWPAHDTFPEPYWHFTRFGNVIIMGGILSVFGSDVGGLYAASWLYHLMMAFAVLVSLMLAAIVIKFVQPSISSGKIRIGILISGVLFISSEVYGYLSNNFVATPPNLLLLSASCVSFILGLSRKSISWMVLSGGLATLAYIVRMDSIWLYLSFMMALATVRMVDRREYTWWPGFIWAAVTALLAFLAYYTIFYPLPDPRLFVEFSKIWRRGLSPSFHLLLPAGGLLWIGALVGILSIGRSRAFQFALLWFLILALPWLPNLMSGGQNLQTRHFSLLLQPLMVASTLGWLWLFDLRGNQFIRPNILAFVSLATAILLCFSHPAVFNRILELPGLWRLQTLRPYVNIPYYEKVSYPIDEFSDLSRAMVAERLPAIIVRDFREENFIPSLKALPTYHNNHEALSVLRFLGPSYSNQADLAMLEDPKNPLPCASAKPSWEEEPLMFCVNLTKIRKEELALAEIHIFRLTVIHNGPVQLVKDEKLILRTEHYQLTRVVEQD
jgi:hypothetical protein